jgi:uncharacterized protein YoxC
MTLDEAVKEIEQLHRSFESLDERTRRCERVREYVLFGGTILTLAVVIVFGWHPRDVAREIATNVATNEATKVANKVAKDVASDVAQEVAARTAEATAESVASEKATIALPILRHKVELVARQLVPLSVETEVKQVIPGAVDAAVRDATNQKVLEDIQGKRETAQKLVAEIKQAQMALANIKQNARGDIEIKGQLRVIGGSISVSGVDGREHAGIDANAFSLLIENREVARIDNAGGDGHLYLSFGEQRAKLSAGGNGEQRWEK